MENPVISSIPTPTPENDLLPVSPSRTNQVTDRDVTHADTTTATNINQTQSTLVQTPGFALLGIQTGFRRAPSLLGSQAPFITLSRACTKSALPAAALCGARTNLASLASISTSRKILPPGNWQSNDSAIAPNLKSAFRRSVPQWAAALDPIHASARLPSRRVPGSTPHGATLPTDAPDPRGRSNIDPAGQTARLMNRVPIRSHSAMCVLQGQRQAVRL